jgi:hypothetical protein
MAEHQQLAAPGPEHRQLSALAGDWDQEVKFWMAPGQPPMTIKGKCHNRMILGGRFLVSETKAEGAFPVETMSIFGFDRRHKKFVTVGLDTMGTYYVTGAGPYSDARRAIVMSGEDQEVGHVQEYDFVLRIESADKYTVEVIFKDAVHTQGKGEFKVVEIVHTRVK